MTAGLDERPSLGSRYERDEDLRARVAEVLPGIRADLEDLVRIESVSADPARAAEVQRSAEAVRALFEAEGCDDGDRRRPTGARRP